VNQKIDPVYLKKQFKPTTDGRALPFYELMVSRKTTFEELLKVMSVKLQDSPKRGRLHLEDQVISGAKLWETLEEFGISKGQVIYVEYATSSNQWPTDNVA
jgi:hypothetical protein